jgi:hypothetical protein
MCVILAVVVWMAWGEGEEGCRGGSEGWRRRVESEHTRI